jgi:transcription elongation factor/antiterminator RfaH
MTLADSGKRGGMSVSDLPPDASAETGANGPFALRDGARWYAVHTLPHAEKKAAAHLENQRFRAFLPKRQKTIRHARKLSTVVAPFFPRYLFVALDLNRQHWRSVNGTVGVASLVMAGERPIALPHGVVESMLATADAHGLLRVWSNLKVGSTVRLAAGPFAEQLGILDRMDDSGRVRVLLDILGRQVPVCLSRAHALATVERPSRRERSA